MTWHWVWLPQRAPPKKWGRVKIAGICKLKRSNIRNINGCSRYYIGIHIHPDMQYWWVVQVETRPEFDQLLRQCQAHQRVQGMPLSFYLLKPVKRVMEQWNNELYQQYRQLCWNIKRCHAYRWQSIHCWLRNWRRALLLTTLTPRVSWKPCKELVPCVNRCQQMEDP